VPLLWRMKCSVILMSEARRTRNAALHWL
jgi:hypothetical protein